MITSVKEIETEKPHWGLSRTVKFRYDPVREEMEKILMNKKFKRKDIFRKCQKKFGNSLVVKIGFSEGTMFALLSDGRLFSKDLVLKDFNITLGRESVGNYGTKERKQFHEIQFKDPNNPNQPIHIVDISGGEFHVLALDYDRNVWAWGANDFKQINPYTEQKDFVLPFKIEHKQHDFKISQIFAFQNTTMLVCKDNQVYMFGSVMEGYVGQYSDDLTKTRVTKEIYNVSMITNYLNKEMNLNGKSYIDSFTNAKKLFNTKLHQLLKDNYYKKELVLEKERIRDNLRKEMEERVKNYITYLDNYSFKFPCKEISTLIELLKYFEEKLARVIASKNENRRKLLHIDEELVMVNNDFTSYSKELKRVKKKLDKNKEEAEKLKQNEKKYKPEDFKKLRTENEKMKNKLETDEFSMVEHLKVTMKELEIKEKEKSFCGLQVNKMIEKENQLLEFRYIVENMTQIVMEATPVKIVKEVDPIIEKHKKKYNELINYYENLERNTFFEINKWNPAMIIEDILAKSDKEINKTETDLTFDKYALPEADLKDLKDLYTLLETKCHLIREQNNLVRYVYSIFLPLKDEFLKKEAKKARAQKLKSIPYLEHKYTELIIQFLKDVQKTEVFEFNFTKNEMEKIENAKIEYKDEKKKLVEKLESRSKFSAEKNFGIDVKADEVKTFSYEKNKGKSFFTFF